MSFVDYGYIPFDWKSFVVLCVVAMIGYFIMRYYVRKKGGCS